MSTTQSWSGINGHAQSAIATSMCEPEHPMVDRAPATLDGLRVLLVEDSWHIAIAVKSLLENAGMTVEGPAGSLARANALLDRNDPDLAIVDINIKGVMSFDLIDRLVGRSVPVVVVSGYSESARLEGKAAAVLEKPVRAGELMEALRQAAATIRRLS